MDKKICDDTLVKLEEEWMISFLNIILFVTERRSQQWEEFNRNPRHDHRHQIPDFKWTGQQRPRDHDHHDRPQAGRQAQQHPRWHDRQSASVQIPSVWSQRRELCRHGRGEVAQVACAGLCKDQHPGHLCWANRWVTFGFFMVWAFTPADVLYRHKLAVGSANSCQLSINQCHHRILWPAGLWDQIKIKSYLVIESNVLAWIKSYADQIECFFFFDFLYDLIWSGEVCETKKSKTMTVKSENFTESDHKWFCQLVFDILVYPPLKIDQFHDCNDFF